MTRRGPKPAAPDGAARDRRLSIPLTDGELAAVKTAAAATKTAVWARDVLLVAATETKKEPTDAE